MVNLRRMKPFLIRLGIVAAVAAAGLLTGYLLIVGERNSLRTELEAAMLTCTSDMESTGAQMSGAKRDIAFYKGIVALHEAKRDLVNANYGVAQKRLSIASVHFGEAATGALDRVSTRLTTAQQQLIGVQAAINNQDSAASEQLDGIISALGN